MKALMKLLHRSLPTLGFCFILFYIGALALSATSGNASQVTVTLSGVTTTGSGNDITGYFLAPGTNMAGNNFTLMYTIDDSLGSAYIGTYPACSNGKQNASLTNNPILNAVLTINGTSYTYGQFSPHSLTANVGSENATSPKMSLVGERSTTFTGAGTNISGSENAQYELDLNSTTTCRDWKTSYSYSPVVGTDTTTIGTLSADWGTTTPSATTVEFSGKALIQNITITGGGTFPTMATTSGQNYSCPTCNPYEQSAQAEGIPPNVAQGDPINAAVGNMTISETDFAGPENTHLNFVRTYNSLDTTNVGLGVGWHSTYHHGLAITSSTSITATAANGRQDVFTLTGGNWLPQANVTSALVSTTSPTGYKLTLPDDTVENYNSSGQLTSVVTRNGLSTALT